MLYDIVGGKLEEFEINSKDKEKLFFNGKEIDVHPDFRMVFVT